MVDVTASYAGRDCSLWMGSVKRASVVEAPNTALVAHGKRGIESSGVEPGTTPQWFYTENKDPRGPTGEGQVLYPYHTEPRQVVVLRRRFISAGWR